MELRERGKPPKPLQIRALWGLYGVMADLWKKPGRSRRLISLFHSPIFGILQGLPRAPHRPTASCRLASDETRAAPPNVGLIRPRWSSRRDRRHAKAASRYFSVGIAGTPRRRRVIFLLDRRHVKAAPRYFFVKRQGSPPGFPHLARIALLSPAARRFPARLGFIFLHIILTGKVAMIYNRIGNL